MAKVQAYVSDEIVYKINKIVERRRAEGAKSTDVSFSSISTMLLELGLRVYEKADRLITERLVQALGLVDIRVPDHLIVGGSQVFSFAEHGLL